MKLLWTLALLIPVLYVNQEMVLRLGAVTRRRPCPADLRAVRQVLGRVQRRRPVDPQRLDDRHRIHRGVPGAWISWLPQGGRDTGRRCAAVRGGRRRFVPSLGAADVRADRGEHRDLPACTVGTPRHRHQRARPDAPLPGGQDSTVLLLIMAIVGTTVAPWQLFFQQSNVVDKRITPRWIPYGRADLVIGIVGVMAGAFALMAVTGVRACREPARSANSPTPGRSLPTCRDHVGHTDRRAVRDRLAGRIVDRCQLRRAGHDLRAGRRHGQAAFAALEDHRGAAVLRRLRCAAGRLGCGRVQPRSRSRSDHQGVQALAGVLLCLRRQCFWCCCAMTAQ